MASGVEHYTLKVTLPHCMFRSGASPGNIGHLQFFTTELGFAVEKGIKLRYLVLSLSSLVLLLCFLYNLRFCILFMLTAEWESLTFLSPSLIPDTHVF